MHTARIEGTAPPVQVAAQELRGWEPEVVSTTDFRCIGCAEPLIPKAFALNKRVQAYFSLYQRHRHQPGCVEGPAAVAGHIGDDLAADGIPAVVPWPTQLIAALNHRETIAAPGAGLPSADRGRATTHGAVDGDRRRGAPQPIRAYSIRAFAHAFLRMNIEQRTQARIHLPGVHADRYRYAFKRLPQWSIDRLPVPRRVFYGQLRWTARIEDTGTVYRIELFAGEWGDGAKAFQRPWELRVDHTDWTDRGRTAFRNELESALNQARDQGKQPWFFALATQNPDAPGVIETRDRQHVAFIPLDASFAPK